MKRDRVRNFAPQSIGVAVPDTRGARKRRACGEVPRFEAACLEAAAYFMSATGRRLGSRADVTVDDRGLIGLLDRARGLHILDRT